MKKNIIIILTICLLITISSTTPVVFSSNHNNIIFNRNTIIVDDEGDGDYTEIQEAVSHANDGDIIEVYSGTYRENIVVNTQVSLIGLDYELGSGDDTGKPIIDGSAGNDPTIKLRDDNCLVQGFQFENGHTAAIHVSWSSNTRVIGNTILENFDCGILLDHGDGNVASDNAITDSTDGIGVVWGSDHSIINNTIANRIWIVDSQSITVEDNRIQDGIFINGIYIQHWNTHTIVNNTANSKPIYYYKNMDDIIVPCDAAQIFLANCTNFLIQDLTISNVFIGVQLGYSSDIVISGNEINLCTFSFSGIALCNSSYTKVTGNTITSNGECWSGIRLDDNCHNNELSDNNISFNAFEGIKLEGSSRNTILRNHIFGNECGVSIQYSHNNTVFENLISTNTMTGIGLCYRASHNNISRNNITQNAIFGIIIEGASNNTVIENNIANGNNGLIILPGFPSGSSDNNKIYHNNFVNNELNSYDECTNFWDNDYPSGGNYWDNYTGSDINHGPNQNISGGDGIGDTVYNISNHNNQDHYPLMNLYSGLEEDEEPPIIEMTKPEEGFLYIADTYSLKRILFNKPLILGKITITVNASDNQSSIDRVEFYIDNELKETDTTEPYSWIWNEITPFRFMHTIKVIAYDGAENSATDEIPVFELL